MKAVCNLILIISEKSEVPNLIEESVKLQLIFQLGVIKISKIVQDKI